MQIYKLKADFRITEDCVLPKYKTQMFRGIFGNTFRRLFCKNMQERECVKCRFKYDCEVAKNFHNLVLEPDSLPKRYRGYSNLSPQYVFYLPANDKDFAKNQLLSVYITFFGYPKMDLRLLVLILLKIGDTSVIDYKSNASLSLVSLEDVSTNRHIFTNGSYYDETLTEVDLEKNAGIWTTRRLVFKSPCRVIKQGIRISNQLDERILTEIMQERLHVLSLSIPSDYKAEWDSNEIEILDKNLFWTEVKHKSHRQGKDLKLGGFIGDMIITSKNKNFWDDLCLLEEIHLGSNTQSGYGKFILSTE
jgi:hypothetical protein